MATGLSAVSERDDYCQDLTGRSPDRTVRITRNSVLLTVAHDALRSHPDSGRVVESGFIARKSSNSPKSGFDEAASAAGAAVRLLSTLRAS